jgi:hypothetical protein
MATGTKFEYMYVNTLTLYVCGVCMYILIYICVYPYTY